MLQESKLNKLGITSNNSFNGKSDSVNMTMKEVSKFWVSISKYLKFVVLIEILLILGFGYLLLIGPQLNKLSDLNSNLKNKKDQLKILEDYQNQTKNLENSYAKIKNAKISELGDLKNILPQEKDLPELIAQVEALTLYQGLILGNITINNSGTSQTEKQNKQNTEEQKSIENELIKEIEVSVTILGGDGTYEKVKKLLDAMENHIRLIDITSFAFDEKMTSYSIIFKTYFLKNDEK